MLLISWLIVFIIIGGLVIFVLAGLAVKGNKFNEKYMQDWENFENKIDDVTIQSYRKENK